jgi:hypothetical protein
LAQKIALALSPGMRYAVARYYEREQSAMIYLPEVKKAKKRIT